MAWGRSWGVLKSVNLQLGFERSGEKAGEKKARLSECLTSRSLQCGGAKSKPSPQLSEWEVLGSR